MAVLNMKRIMEDGSPIEVAVDLAHINFHAAPTVDKPFYKGCTAAVMSCGVVLVLKVKPEELTKLKNTAR